jgi:hypothetical protein
MRTVFASGALLVAGVFGHSHSDSHYHSHDVNAAAWPKENLYNSFKVDLTLHSVANRQLVPIDNLSATAKVDGTRSKIHVDAKLTLPALGVVKAELVVDTKAGTIKAAVPALKICQQDTFDIQFDLAKFLNRLNDQTGGLTTYDGQQKPEWENVAYDRFTTTVTADGDTVTTSTYFDVKTNNGRWVDVTGDVLDNYPRIVISTPNGEIPATFSDSDFVISSCAVYDTNAVNHFDIFDI